MSRFGLSLACNDHRNGGYRGTFCAAEFSLDGDREVSVIGPETEMHRTNDALVVGFRVFKIRGWAYWVGNWCWDECLVSLDVARDLYRHLIALGFTIEEASLEGPLSDLVISEEGWRLERQHA